MLKKRAVVFVILAILLTQTIVMKTSFSSSAIVGFSTQNTISTIQPSSGLISPDAVAGTELVQKNVFVDGDCERAATNGEPTGFNGQVSSYSVANFSYQDDVHSGTYSGYMSNQGTPQYGSSFDRYRLMTSPERAYIDENIQLDLWYNAKENPDFARGSEIQFYVRCSTNIGTYYIRYYLSRVSGLPSNSSTTVYYDIRGSLNSWTNVVRNVTEDFVQAFSGGPDISLSYANFFSLVITSVSDPSGATVLLIDDMSITNTTGFEYFADNGDFEDGDSTPWFNIAYGEGTIYTTKDDYTQGTSAMNITIDNPYSIRSNAYATAEQSIFYGWTTIPKGYYAGKPGDLVFNFDWKYADTPSASGEQFSYFYIRSANTTFSADYYFMLGDQNDVIPFTNTTASYFGYYYMKADGFGIRDTWQEFTLDYYTFVTELGFTNQIPYRIGFHAGINLLEENSSRIQLLVDDFQMVTYPAGDYSFEGNFQYSPTDPIVYWITSGNHNYVNITTDAHTGNYAANLTAYTGLSNTYCYKRTNMLVTPYLYTDFSWRLDKMTAASSQAYSTINLELNNTKTIVYILGSNSYFVPVNTSNTCYYFVEDYNQTGTWNNLIRDLYVDVIQAFSSTNYYVTEIDLRTYAAATEVASTIYDDINFITDITGPIISNLDQTPGTPQYGEPVTITVEVVDNFEVEWVELRYKIGADPYTGTPMTFNGAEYEAVIPAADYGTEVYYYVEAQDINYILTVSGSAVSYIVTDLIDPIIIVEHPSELEDLTGVTLFNITALDYGSGIASFEISIDGFTVYDQLTPPMTYQWNTTNYTNSQHSIVFTANDNAANEYWIGYAYTIYNEPEQTPTLSPTPTETLTNTTTTSPTAGYGLIIPVIGFLIITPIVLIIRRKRK